MSKDGKPRRSFSLMPSMHDNPNDTDYGTLFHQRVQWETAVPHELGKLYNKQDELQAQIQGFHARIAQDSPNLNINLKDAFESG